MVDYVNVWINKDISTKRKKVTFLLSKATAILKCSWLRVITEELSTFSYTTSSKMTLSKG